LKINQELGGGSIKLINQAEISKDEDENPTITQALVAAVSLPTAITITNHPTNPPLFFLCLITLAHLVCLPSPSFPSFPLSPT